MIVKHVAMKSVHKSNFAELVKYMMDEQAKYERVGNVNITNCHTERTDVAILAIQNTQTQNTRAETDKTYHLVVSFPSGEQPEDAILHAIENRICEGLGYGEHQRVSVVHHDTDNLHMHIAINKIHPTRYTMHDPFNAYHTIGRLCEKLEMEYGLMNVNHRAQKVGSENRAQDMECHSGVESLLGWIKRECSNQMLSATTWADLHQVMKNNGLELKERGNGLVIIDQSGLMVKASSVARDLSKVKLEAKFGGFTPSIEQVNKTASGKKYESRPIKSRINTVELYARYRTEQQNMGEKRSQAWEQARERRNRLIEDAKRSGRLKRAGIKFMANSKAEKKLLYTIASKGLKTEIARINQSYHQEKQMLFEKHQPQQWADWLRQMAVKGDKEALAALRGREAAQGLKGDTMSANGGQRVKTGIEVGQDSITKTGTIIYRVGASAIRDDGDQLKVSRQATKDGIVTALRLAMEKYGNRITVNGSHDFKEKIAVAAVTAKLPITFADEVLERRRQALLSMTDKPKLGRIGNQPPPESRGHLRNLSDIAVMHIDSGNEGTLPGRVSSCPEHSEKWPDTLLQRPVHGGKPDAGVAAANLYIKEREQKRLNGLDILKHRLQNDKDTGKAIFSGLRQIEDHHLALMKLGDDILVMPISKAIERKMKWLAIGDPVTLSKNGVIKISKGRGRSR